MKSKSFHLRLEVTVKVESRNFYKEGVLKQKPMFQSLKDFLYQKLEVKVFASIDDENFPTSSSFWVFAWQPNATYSGE